MDHQNATRGDRDAPDGLLVVVDGTGIPVLVRPYGDVQKPPSAAVGIVSAVFHAARMGDTTELRALRSASRTIVYILEGEILLAFVQCHRPEEAETAQLSLERMLRIVLRSLQLAIGPAMADLESPKLRVAISRNLAVIDYVVTHITDHKSLSLELPVVKVGLRRGRITPQTLPRGLLYAAWIEDGVICHEIGSAGKARCNGVDLALVSLIAKLLTTSKAASATVWIDGALKIVGMRARYQGERQFVFGIFVSAASSADIATFSSIVDEEWAVESLTQPSDYDTLKACLDFECCFVLPLTTSVARRAIAFGRPNQEDGETVDTVAPPMVWTMLSQFVWACRMSCEQNPQRMDYKQEDETFTFINCTRNPFAIYAVCRRRVTMPSVVQFGDMIASYVMTIQM